jgi:membrane fusion protein (multidrug efflux system)
MRFYLTPTRIAGMLSVSIFILMAGCGKSAPPAAKAGPPEVGVVRVAAQRLTVTTELPGRTNARLVAEIRPQVGGIVQKRLFEEGAQVKAGQVLYQIDPASFAASVASAQASVGKAEAALNAARMTAERNAELVKIKAISAQVNDDSQAAYKQAKAELEVVRAALATARINLERTRIAAPISGRVDMSTVTPGALVTANQEVALTTVQQLDSLYVDVSQSSSELLRLKRDFASGALKRSGENEAPIRLVLEDGTMYPHPGKLQFSGVTVNRGTGAVTLRAVVPNPDGVLMPGMYVRAQLESGVAENALLVPQQGVTRTPSGEASALVVGAGNKVERRVLKVDRAVGNRWQVLSGLQEGDLLIVDGLQRIKPGAVVQTVAVQLPGAAGPAAATPDTPNKPAATSVPLASATRP